MNPRVLWIELRRSSGLWSALLIAGIGVLPFWALIAAFGPDRAWLSLVAVQRDFLFLFAPLALAAGAWQARRDRSSRVEELFATTPRPRLGRVLPASAAMAIAMGAAYVVMLGLWAAVGLRPINTYFPVGAVPMIAVGALTLVALALLGMAIGRALPWAIVPPILAVAGIVGLVMVGSTVGASAADGPSEWSGAYLMIPSVPNLTNNPAVFMVSSVRSNLGQAIWLIALAAAGLALLAATSRRAAAFAVAPAVLGAALAVPVLPAQLGHAYVLDRGANVPVCTSDTPKVCVNRVDSRVLGEWREPGRKALAILAAKLPDAPNRVEVYTWVARDVTMLPGSGKCPYNYCPHGSRPPQTLTLELAFRGFREGATIPVEHYVWHLLAGAGAGPCPELLAAGGALDEEYLATRWAAAAWLIGEALPPDLLILADADIHQLTGEIQRDLSTLPAERQRANVAALRQAEHTCAPGDRRAMLTGDR